MLYTADCTRTRTEYRKKNVRDIVVDSFKTGTYRNPSVRLLPRVKDISIPPGVIYRYCWYPRRRRGIGLRQLLLCLLLIAIICPPHRRTNLATSIALPPATTTAILLLTSRYSHARYRRCWIYSTHHNSAVAAAVYFDAISNSCVVVSFGATNSKAVV